MAIAAQAAIAAWYIQHMASLREQVATAQQQAYHAQGDYSDDAADAYVATVVPLMAGAQAAASQLTAAYLAYMVADLTGQALSSAVARAVDLSKVTGSALRNGLRQEQLYRRPFQQVWTDLAKSDAPKSDAPEPTSTSRGSEATTGAVRRPTQADGEDQPSVSHAQDDPGPRNEPSSAASDRSEEPEVAPEPPTKRDKAVAAGERRAQTIGLTDLQLATTRTAQDVLGANQSVIGYRRVLTGAENCGMCVVASTRLYHKRNLMPIHPACDCVVAPVMAGEDPGRTLNNRTIGADAVPKAFNKHGVPIFDADQTIDMGDLLQETHDAIKERFGVSFADAKRIDYRKVITVRQHGETGPTLTVARHRFTKRRIESNDLRARNRETSRP